MRTIGLALDCFALAYRCGTMKPTHQLKMAGHEDIIAWQYTKTGSIPAWVFRNFHRLGDQDVLTHRGGEKVRLTEWIVVDPEHPKIANVLTDEEFQNHFTALPEPKKANG